MIDGLLMGLSAAISPFNLMMVFIGCFLGTFIGMLPGLGPMSIIAIMIPIAIQLGDPASALILLSGVYYGAIFGGSTSSILINAPGVAGTNAIVGVCGARFSVHNDGNTSVAHWRLGHWHARGRGLGDPREKERGGLNGQHQRRAL